MFGLTNSEGNHGEDVKEYYFYLDNTPTHSYMKYLYKYPQAAFPYNALIQTNRQRSRYEFEYELLDTGIFDENRYYDVFVEYAKQDPEDILVQITIHNRGSEKAVLRLLPTLWFRNIWWQSEDAPCPELHEVHAKDPVTAISVHHSDLKPYTFFYSSNRMLLLSTFARYLLDSSLLYDFPFSTYRFEATAGYSHNNCDNLMSVIGSTNRKLLSIGCHTLCS